MDGGSAPPQPLAAAGDDDPATNLATLRARFEEQAAAAGGRAAWEALRLAWLGRKQGVLRDLLARIGSVPAEDRKAFGELVGSAKAALDKAATA